MSNHLPSDPNVSYHGSDAPLATSAEDCRRRQKAAVSRERDRRRREEAEARKVLERSG